MSPLRIRGLLRHHRRRLAVIVATLVVGSLVAAHHAPGMGMDVGMGDADMAMVVCLAVFPLLAAPAVLRGRASWPRPPDEAFLIGCTPGSVRCAAVEPRARAGPPPPRVMILRL